jgi:hypothetical protein
MQHPEQMFLPAGETNMGREDQTIVNVCCISRHASLQRF